MAISLYYAPFVSDLNKYYINNKFDINKVTFEFKDPIDPFTQLLAVIPPQYSDILPESYRSLVKDIDSPIIEYYPEEVELDLLYKDIFWKCLPLIPCVDLDKIINSVKDIKI